MQYCLHYYHGAGGAEADKHVRAAIKKALTPAALPGAAKGCMFALNVSNSRGMNSRHPFSMKTNFHDIFGNGFLCAVWGAQDLAKEYDMKVMAEPVVHESADKDLLAGEVCTCQ